MATAKESLTMMQLIHLRGETPKIGTGGHGVSKDPMETISFRESGGEITISSLNQDSEKKRNIYNMLMQLGFSRSEKITLLLALGKQPMFCAVDVKYKGVNVRIISGRSCVKFMVKKRLYRNLAAAIKNNKGR